MLEIPSHTWVESGFWCLDMWHIILPLLGPIMVCGIIRDQAYLSSWAIRPRNWLLIKIWEIESPRDWGSINHDCQEVNELDDWRGYKLDLIQRDNISQSQWISPFLSIHFFTAYFYIQQFPIPIYIQVIYDSALYILPFLFLHFIAFLYILVIYIYVIYNSALFYPIDPLD